MMEVILKAFVLAVLLLFIFYDLGFLLPFSGKEGEASLTETLCSGFLIYTAALEAVGLMCTWIGTGQSLFFSIWGTVLSVGVVASFVLHIGKWWQQVKYFFCHLRFRPMALLAVVILALVIGAECFLAFGSSVCDGANTAAVMATDLANDALAGFDPISGARVGAISPQLLLSRWTLGGELLCMLADISPMHYLRYTGNIVTIVLSNLILFRIAMRLFDKSYGKSILLLLFFTMGQIFFCTKYTAASSLLLHGYAGDAIFVNVILLQFFLLALAIYEQEAWHHLFLLTFFAGIAGFCVSEYAVMLMLPLLIAVLLPATLLGKKWMGVIWLLLSGLVFLAGFVFCLAANAVPFGI